MNRKFVGEGKVKLVSGGGRCYTDIAARFTSSGRDIDSIIASEYDRELIEKILSMGHLATTEFDYFLFAVEGYSRVTEIQMVRKRMASYMISSGRLDKKGKRKFDIVVPHTLDDLSMIYDLPPYIDKNGKIYENKFLLTPDKLYNMIESLYNHGVEEKIPEEDLRYMKPQGTEFKALIGMNGHSLLQFFNARCCMNAQTEIRDMANKMLKIAKEVSPDLFKNAGPYCKTLGYCPENKYQNKKCTGKVITKDEVDNLIKEYIKSR